MSPHKPEEDLWAGISGIPFFREFLSDGQKMTVTCRISLKCRIPDSENSADFSLLKKIVNDETLKFSSPESVSSTMMEQVLERSKDYEAAMCSLIGEMTLREKSGRVIGVQYSSYCQSDRDGNARYRTELTATGMTACPCSMDKIRKKLTEKHPSQADSIQSLPQVTHNQRVHVTVSAEFSAYPGDIILPFLEIAENAIGNLVSFHGGQDAETILLDAHENPKMVEDVARKGSELFRAKFSPIDGIISAGIKCESEESIHSFNAISEKRIIF